MKIVVLGSTGMLGNAVTKYFTEIYGENNIIPTYRKLVGIELKNSKEYDPIIYPDNISIGPLPNCDVVINCIGVIKPFMKDNVLQAILLNSVFPRKLANYCSRNKIKLFHITTDCVFSGKDGQYTENSLHDALDDYGKSKSLGEPENCMVIRTSIIGEEIHKNASLIAWVKSEAGKEVKGFTNHLWNGITTKQYAKIIHTIIENNLYQEGLYHAFSPNSVNKKELVEAISDRFDLNIKVNPVEAQPPCDRTLTTVKDLCEKLNIPTIQEQLSDL